MRLYNITILEQSFMSHNNQFYFCKKSVRPKSALRPSTQMLDFDVENKLKEQSINMIKKLNDQVILPQQHFQCMSKSVLTLDTEPKPLKTSWKVKHSRKSNFLIESDKKSDVKVVTKKFRRLNYRVSFEDQLQDNQKIQSTKKQIKFPSQKSIIQKQKVVPLALTQKQKYAIQFCRIIKDKHENLMKQSQNEQKTFNQQQIKKYKKYVQQNEKKNPLITFNYDGGIINIQPSKFHHQNQTIDCIAECLDQVGMQNKKPHNNQKKIKEIKHDSFFFNFQSFQEIGSEYLQNFQKIKWNSKIMVGQNLDAGRKKRLSRFIPKKQQMPRNRVNTISVCKKNIDHKSTIHIENNQIFQQFLFKKRIRQNEPKNLRKSLQSYNENYDKCQDVQCSLYQKQNLNKNRKKLNEKPISEVGQKLKYTKNGIITKSGQNNKTLIKSNPLRQGQSSKNKRGLSEKQMKNSNQKKQENKKFQNQKYQQKKVRVERSNHQNRKIGNESQQLKQRLWI